MSDLKGFGIWFLSITAKMLLFFPAIYQGVTISAKNKRLGDYGFSLGIGQDIYGNKLIAPHANKYWVKPGGKLFGGDETISKVMAFNKKFNYNTKYADRWERLINLLDKDHLNKTSKKYELN